MNRLLAGFGVPSLAGGVDGELLKRRAAQDGGGIWAWHIEVVDLRGSGVGCGVVGWGGVGKPLDIQQFGSLSEETSGRMVRQPVFSISGNSLDLRSVFDNWDRETSRQQFFRDKTPSASGNLGACL